ncbi:MAG: hypothetical protein ABJN26_01720 [Stappiaceae bacterium]
MLFCQRGRGAVKTILVGLLLFSAAACGRPVGDFNRAEPNVIHDKVLPAFGNGLARARKEPVSNFPLTNDEKLLRNLGWGLVRPPHAGDWIAATIVEAQRTRITKAEDWRLDPREYFRLLISDKYRSSDARYDRVIADANADAQLVRPFCRVAERVNAADKERLAVIRRTPQVSQQRYAGATARVWENQQVIEWAERSMEFRLKAYKYAIEQLQIETPSATRVWDANTAWRRFAGAVAAAQQGCNKNFVDVTEAPVQQSRIYTGWGLEREAPIK